jgi:hypothetical protein
MLAAIKSTPITSIESINEPMKAIVETLARGENDARALAKHFYDIYANPERDAFFAERDLFMRNADGTVKTDAHGVKKVLPFAKAIDALFAGVYSGNTAYKYTQVYKAFHSRDEWSKMNVGKLIILTPLMSEKAKNDGYSIESFYFNMGCDYYRPTKDAHDNWIERNETTLATISALENSGNHDLAEKQKAMLEPEPVILGYVIDDSTGSLVYDVPMCTDKGAEIVPEMSDKELKSKVSEFIKWKTGKLTSDDSKESKTDEGKEKTIAELKADALSALLAYMDALESDAPEYMLDTADYLKEE